MWMQTNSSLIHKSLAFLNTRTFEDFRPGLRLSSSPCKITAEEIKCFARNFDPQLFHLDSAKAETTIFGGLAASGWNTAAVSMRLFVQTMSVAGGIIGLGVDELRWPNAVRPDDELRLEIEILETRLSKSRASYGIIRVRNTTRNQRGEVVQSFTATAMVPRRDR